jgi:hypothetical protein
MTGLGLFLRGAGVAPERAEEIIRDYLDCQPGGERDEWLRGDLRAICDTLDDGLNALRIDQTQSLGSVGVVVGMIRREAGLYQRAFVRSMSRTSLWIAALCVLQVALIGTLVFLRYADVLFPPSDDRQCAAPAEAPGPGVGLG